MQVTQLESLANVVASAPSLVEVNLVGNPCFPSNTDGAREALLALLPTTACRRLKVLNGTPVTVGERMAGVRARHPDSPQAEAVCDAMQLEVVVADVGYTSGGTSLDLSFRGLTRLGSMVRGCGRGHG
jgi:hypothetical protein